MISRVSLARLIFYLLVSEKFCLGSIRILKVKEVPDLLRVFFCISVAVWLGSGMAVAAPLEEINFTTESDKVIATIKLSSPVANVRYAPAHKGSTLSILLDKLPSGPAMEEWQDNEVLKSPPSSLIPSFTVKTNLKNIQPKLIIDFSREAEYLVQMGRDGRSIVVNIKIDKLLPSSDGAFPFLPEVQPLLANASEINQKAFSLIQQARNALASKDNFTAVDAFNRLLLLPPNDYTQDGQEWVGVARERAGQKDKAKLEYELYLKLYPAGTDANRVKDRLARLNAHIIKPSPSMTVEQKVLLEQPSQTLVYGSLSMNYYHGASKIDTTDVTTQFSSVPISSSFSAVDQSSLISNVDMTGRFISGRYDNRVVFRDTAYSNFLDGQRSKNKVNSAYYEFKDKLADYSVRVGRQSGTGAGVLGRFDGAAAGVGITPAFRLNAVAGKLSDYILGEPPVFYGASADMGPVTLYAINQSLEGISDRKAVGTEIRYFDAAKSAFTMVDYDTSYSTVNIAMFQGSIYATPERTYNLLLDHRRAPYISIRNALMGASTVYLNDLLQLLTEDELRDLAAARTGTANMGQLGFTQQLSQKWQIGADVRVSNYEGLPASGLIDPATQLPTITGVIAETPGTGNEFGISSQMIGSNLYSSRDSTVLSMTFTSSPVYKGQIFYIYNRSNFSDKWSFDASFQYYRLNYDSGTVMTRVMPMLRTAYQVRQSVSLNMDAGLEATHTESLTQISDGQRQFYSVGFRWDF